MRWRRCLRPLKIQNTPAQECASPFIVLSGRRKQFDQMPPPPSHVISCIPAQTRPITRPATTLGSPIVDFCPSSSPSLMGNSLCRSNLCISSLFPRPSSLFAIFQSRSATTLPTRPSLSRHPSPSSFTPIEKSTRQRREESLRHDSDLLAVDRRGLNLPFDHWPPLAASQSISEQERAGRFIWPLSLRHFPYFPPTKSAPLKAVFPSSRALHV